MGGLVGDPEDPFREAPELAAAVDTALLEGWSADPEGHHGDLEPPRAEHGSALGAGGPWSNPLDGHVARPRALALAGEDLIHREVGADHRDVIVGRVLLVNDLQQR